MAKGKKLRREGPRTSKGGKVWLDGMVCGRHVAVCARMRQVDGLLRSLRRDVAVHGRAPMLDMYRYAFRDCCEAATPSDWDIVFLNLCRTALFDVPSNLYLVEPRLDQLQPVDIVRSVR